MTTRSNRGVIAIETLERVRADCPALNSLFLPDDMWPEFRAWHAQPDKSLSGHRSMLLLALERGHLARLTGPVHRYLVENGVLRPDVRKQYLKDMREHWMLNSDPHERNLRSGRFTGRTAELQFAEWIETTRRRTIVGLEVLREGPDVEAQDELGLATAFEVKAIGIEHNDFEMILRGMAEPSVVGPISPYAAINYLLFRTYEAAKQLAHFEGSRITVVVISDLNWHRFDWQLDNRWIDWDNPAFLSADSTWEAFLQSQVKRYPEIRTEVASVVTAIDAVWVMKRSYGYEYSLEYEIPTSHV
jgi:hypothetical protein